VKHLAVFKTCVVGETSNSNASNLEGIAGQASRQLSRTIQVGVKAMLLLQHCAAALPDFVGSWNQFESIFYTILLLKVEHLMTEF